MITYVLYDFLFLTVFWGILLFFLVIMFWRSVIVISTETIWHEWYPYHSLVTVFEMLPHTGHRVFKCHHHLTSCWSESDSHYDIIIVILCIGNYTVSPKMLMESMKFGTKLIYHCPPHLQYVAALPCEIRSQICCVSKSAPLSIESQYSYCPPILMHHNITALFVKMVFSD